MNAVPEHVKPEIVALAERGTPVTLEEYRALYMNSYEREYLLEHLSDEALAYTVRNALDNIFVSRRRPCTTYDEALANLYAPELLKRLARANSKIDKLGEAINGVLPRFEAAADSYVREELRAALAFEGGA